MPTVRRSVVLGIAETNNNILTGSIYEFRDRPTRVVIAAVGMVTATSAAIADNSMGVNFGSRTMCQAADTIISGSPSLLAGPNIPDHVIVDDIAMPGERLVISLVGGAAANTVRILVQMTDVA